MKPVTIVGGGLSGLTLGILLRREGVPVTLLEAGTYPRHRVCGEFLSGAGRRILESLNLPSLAARTAQRSRFTLGERSFEMELAEPALCISRYDLDAALAREFERLGGSLLVNHRHSGPREGEGTVIATGRRRAQKSQGHLFGLKAHALNAKAGSEMEIRFGKGCYVGTCRISAERTNVCGLFYARSPSQVDWRTALSMEKLQWDESSFCSVAGITLDPRPESETFSVGDASAMIPPLTGNGMSMAFESAELAAPALLAYTRGKNWRLVMCEHQAAWKKSFQNRLSWAHWLQRAVFQPFSQRTLFLIARAAPSFRSTLFAKTR